MKRVFLIVLDSVGIGEMPDAAEYHDEGSNTLLAASRSPYFSMPNMRSLGYFNIDGVHIGGKEANPKGAFARLTEVSKGNHHRTLGDCRRDIQSSTANISKWISTGNHRRI